MPVNSVAADDFKLKWTQFLPWRPRNTDPAPKLVQVQDLKAITGCAGLRGIEAAECGLTDGQVCHYWFEGTDSHPSRGGWRTLCTDPTGCTVDWRLPADRLSFDISTTFVTLPPS
jgi:hypothetical protein